MGGAFQYGDSSLPKGSNRSYHNTLVKELRAKMTRRETHAQEMQVGELPT